MSVAVRRAAKRTMAAGLACMVGGIIPSIPVWAADDNGSAYEAEAKSRSLSSESFKTMVERLTVAARKREESVQRVPVAVTVLSQDDLVRENRNRRLEDIQNLVPNLVFDGSTAFLANTSRLVLRGFGQSDPSATTDPGVGVYVDGVYQARSSGLSFAPMDIERVEVLRGPQGTLFGKNTVGGAISVTTRKPDFDPSASAELRLGNFATLETRGVANIPLVPEKVAARFSFATATRDGFSKNVFTGQELSDNKLLSGRAELLAYPTDNLEVLLSLFASKENRKPLAGKCVPATDGNPQGAQVGLATGALNACAEDGLRSEFKTASDFPDLQDFLQTYGGTSRITWDLTPDVTITSITGVRQTVLKTFLDFDATQVPLLGNDNDSGRQVQDQFSQEFQLKGMTASGRLRYTLGVFGLNDDVNNRSFLDFMLRPRADGMGFETNPVLTPQSLKLRNLSYALYGQGVYALTERLELTLGARFSNERRRVSLNTRATQCRQGVAPDVCAAALAMPLIFDGFDKTARFSDVSPAAALSYQISPKVLAYVSYGTAFESGGFQGNARRVEDSQELNPQNVTSYELGLKSRAFDDRVLLNAAAFYNVLKDARFPFTAVNANGVTTVSERNAATTVVNGAEVELGVLATSDLQLLATAGVINSRFKNFDTEGIADASIGSERPPLTPNYTLSLRAEYERSLGSMGSLGLQTSWSVRGRMNSDIQATKVLQTNKYGLLDGRLSWGLPDGRTEVAAYGSNLLDRRYFNNGLSFADSIGVAARTIGNPRQYGIEIRRQF